MTEGLASVAAAVLDHTGHPAAGIAVTYPVDEQQVDPAALAADVRRTAQLLTTRLGGRP